MQVNRTFYSSCVTLWTAESLILPRLCPNLSKCPTCENWRPKELILSTRTPLPPNVSHHGLQCLLVEELIKHRLGQMVKALPLSHQRVVLIILVFSCTTMQRARSGKPSKTSHRLWLIHYVTWIARPVCMGKVRIVFIFLYSGVCVCRLIWGSYFPHVQHSHTHTLTHSQPFALLYHPVDIGAGILQDPKETHAKANGYHSGPALNILTRTADIRRATKPDPLTITNDFDNHVHQEDWNLLPKCIDFLKSKSNPSANDATWMLYCSINIPHPAFNTNSTWLKGVAVEDIPTPTWLPKDQFHPADSYMSQSKSVWRNYRCCHNCYWSS